MESAPDNTTPAPAKEPSHKASITGGVLAILSLIASGIGSFLVHADFKPAATPSGSVAKANAAVATGTGHAVASIISLPFLVAGIGLAIIAILLTAIRLGKVKASGLIISLVWIALSGWSIVIAAAAFGLLKAR